MTDPAPISIIIITWNSERTIASCLASLAAQRPRSFPVLIIDNASVDGTLEIVDRAALPVHVIRNPKNLGFSRAANQGIAVTRAPVVAILNPDLMLEPQALEAALRALNDHPEAGSLAPWLFRSADDLSAPVPHGTVDSSGLAVSRGRRIVDRDAGRLSALRPAGPVFGASGALALYRRAALESVRFHHEFFDEDFFAYKEDADLAWRLQRAGWSCWFEPSSRAIHHRGLGATDAPTSDLRAHRARPLALARLSYRNHLLMLLKNESVAGIVPDIPWIAGEELGKFTYYLIRRPRVLAVWFDVVRRIPSVRAKRALLTHQERVSGPELRSKWFRHR